MDAAITEGEELRKQPSASDISSDIVLAKSETMVNGFEQMQKLGKAQAADSVALSEFASISCGFAESDSNTPTLSANLRSRLARRLSAVALAKADR